MDDVDDLFGAAHTLESKWIAEGTADGERDGKPMGIAEGWQLGVVKGYEIGVEVGFYAGCVNIWQQLLAARPDALPARAHKGIATLAAQLKHFPLANPQDESLHDRLEDLKSKFKAVASQLGVLEAYFGKEAAVDKLAF